MSSQKDEAMRKGPSGHTSSGFQVPGPGTLRKGEPADEQSPKVMGVESGGGQDAATLGVLTSGDRAGKTSGGIRQQFVAGAEPGPEALYEAAQANNKAQEGVRPQVAQAKDFSPDDELQPRIPETEREDESPAGLGKGVAVPPGSAGRETGQTP
ncbi:MAG TPA: hypothetical protein VHA57_09085 [Actinomycetota bacterium]|nr:hypothetical protein [Actinomycetota bacterium]